LKADFLSELVNLGGVYSSLRPNMLSPSNSISSLHKMLINSYSYQNISGDDLENYLRRVDNYSLRLKDSTTLLKSFKARITYESNWSNSSWIDSILQAISTYEPSSLISNPGSFLLASSFERNLTDSEINYLVRTFGDSINYSQIRITRGNVVSLGSSKTIGNTIHLRDVEGSPIFQQDGTSLTEEGLILLAHEITHSWQWQNGGFAYTPEALISQFSAWLTTGNRNNAYSWEEADRRGQPWASWNPEQQAEAVEDYNRSIQIYASDPKGERAYAAIDKILKLTKYIIKISDKEGAPSYNDAWKYINIQNFPSVP
jgi:hypothetical protein